MRNQKIIGEGSKKKVQKWERESTRNENISVLLQEDICASRRWLNADSGI